MTKELSSMATSIPIEIESGTSVPRSHQHNGYWAGKASAPRIPSKAGERTQER